MNKKILNVLLCLIVAFCIFASCTSAFAEDEVDYEFNIQPVEPTTQEVTTKAPTTTKPTTEKTTKPTTEKPTTEKPTTEKPTEEPTKRPTERPTEKPTEKPDKMPEERPVEELEETTRKHIELVTDKKENEKTTGKPTTEPRTTRRQTQQNNNNANPNVNAAPQTTRPETTTEEELPEGAFFVYLERNNGEDRLKTMMKKPGLVPEPNEPTREGYVFDGWYSDAKFKNSWNFFTDKATKEMTIYAKWVADDSTVEYDIVIKDTVGGTLQANPGKASKGEAVYITVTPDEGKRLVAGSLLINGESTDVFSFVMPKGKVVITASFEDVPESEEKEEKSKLPFIIIGIVLIIVVFVIVFLATKQRRDFNADLDPDDDLPENDDDDDDSWIDESIIVGDGFVEGKKIVENAEPDYGSPDADEEE